ncbi:MAG TPA: PAS domain-containing protein [Acidimicrobiales bacterium]|nr:PAS domain-containing protein [Acidimicrobiales bacterium]
MGSQPDEAPADKRFRLLAQSLRDDVILMLDANGLVVSCNEGAQRVNGYRADEMVGRHFSCLYLPEEVEAEKPGWELEQALVGGRFETEGWRVTKGGSRLWTNVIITPLTGLRPSPTRRC